MDFSRLKNIIAEKGFTIEQIASDIGMTAPGFHKMFRKQSMKVETLEKICKKIDLDPAILFRGESDVSIKVAQAPYKKSSKQDSQATDLQVALESCQRDKERLWAQIEDYKKEKERAWEHAERLQSEVDRLREKEAS